MSLGTCQFKLPFEAGAPITKKPYEFYYSETFDKYHILNIDDYLARGEVAYLALKNSFFIADRQTRDIRRRAKTVHYLDLPEYEESGYKPPDIFGVFLGRFIPVFSFISDLNLREMSKEELIQTSQVWQEEFFELNLDIWFEVLPGPHKAFEGKVPKPIWVNFPLKDFQKFWKPVHQELVSKGMAPVPLFASKTTETLDRLYPE